MTLRRFKTLLLPLCAACLLLAGWMVYHALSGGQLAGCGAGSGCDSVMGSRWAWTLRGVPVALPAAALYALLLVCILFLEDCRSEPAMTDERHSGRLSSHSGLDPESPSLNLLLWPLMRFFAGCIVGAALWFGYLQAFVLHAFCPYCTALHILGCVAAGIILLAGDCRSEPAMTLFAAGLAAAALFAVVQSKTLPDAIYDTGRTEAALPSFEEGEAPVLGDSPVKPANDEWVPANDEWVPAMTDERHARPDRASITLLFDFQCIHCRRLHRVLPELLARSGGRILLCPVPLSSACNPYIPASGIDRFAGSCPLTRYALAVWYARPDAYADYWEWLLGNGDEHAQIAPDEAEKRARALLGDAFEAALADPRIDTYLRKVEELFGRTSSSEKSGVPRLIRGQHWLVPETDDADELLELIRTEL